ncbi:MAG: hypothetical protein EXQ83_10780 [Xanthobacteraceae bacterium]|nr:hypothetical protein [Xanthobacteraceae bacterium]
MSRMPLARAYIVLASLTAPSSAQDFPNRPMTMVVPFAAGGAVDVLGRTLAARAAEILGQQIVIENVGGAGGMTGANRIAKAAPDGYQFVLGSVAPTRRTNGSTSSPPTMPSKTSSRLSTSARHRWCWSRARTSPPTTCRNSSPMQRRARAS